MKNYEDRLEAMRKDLRKKEEVVAILGKLENNMQWDAMKYVEDESENGHHFEAPSEDDYMYDRYIAYTEIISLIEKKFFS